MEEARIMQYKHKLTPQEMEEKAVEMDAKLLEIETIKDQVSALNSNKTNLDKDVHSISQVRRQGYETRQDECICKWRGDIREWYIKDTGEFVFQEHRDDVPKSEQPGPLHKHMVMQPPEVYRVNYDGDDPIPVDRKDNRKEK